MDAAHSEANDSTASAHASEIPEAAPQKAVADIEQKALEQKTLEQKSKPKLEVDAERIRTSIARLTSNSIGELEGLASELQKLDDFIKFETERVQRDIESLLAGVKIIVETISPWKRSATVSSAPTGPARNVFAGGRGQDTRRNPANA